MHETSHVGPSSIRATLDGEPAPVTPHTLLGSILSALPDCEPWLIETRGEGVIGFVRYGGGRFRVQIDPLGDDR